MELFAGVMWGSYLNADAHFCSFPRAVLTMFRCATGEDWNGLMHDLMVSPELGCDPHKNNCGTWLAIPYFISFQVIGSRRGPSMNLPQTKSIHEPSSTNHP